MFAKKLSTRYRLLRLGQVLSIIVSITLGGIIAKYADYSVFYTGTSFIDGIASFMPTLLWIFSIVMSLVFWVSLDTIASYYSSLFILNAFWLLSSFFINKTNIMLITVISLVGRLLSITSLAFIILAILYMAVYTIAKWIIWNGYSPYFIALTLKGNIRRINNYTEFSISPDATKYEVYRFIKKHHTDIMMSKKFYQVW